MWFLWVFGDNVEDRMGGERFLLFYLLGGVAAALAQALFMPASTVPMIGASGAVSAVLGAYYVLFPRAYVITLVWFVLPFTLALPAGFTWGTGPSSSWCRGFWACRASPSGPTSAGSSSAWRRCGRSFPEGGAGRLGPMKVKDLMTQDPVVLGPEATLEEAARRILETRYGGFPVVDGEEAARRGPGGGASAPPGERPLLRRGGLAAFRGVGGRGRPGGDLPALPAHPVKAVMRTEIPKVHPEDPLGKALKVVLTTDLRHLPVVDEEGKVVGILTRSDFLKLILGRG